VGKQGQERENENASWSIKISFSLFSEKLQPWDVSKTVCSIMVISKHVTKPKGKKEEGEKSRRKKKSKTEHELSGREREREGRFGWVGG